MHKIVLAVCLTVFGLVPSNADESLDLSRVRGLIDDLKADDPQVRADAASALEEFGPEAKSAVRPLISLLTDEERFKTQFGPQTFPVSGPASNALTAIGSESIVDLTAALADPSVSVRSSAAYVLGRIGPKARSALTALREAARDRERDIRLDAADALSKIDNRSIESTRLLMEWAKDEDRSVRQGAVEALGAFREQHETITPVLLQALRDKDPSIRGSAAISLGKIAKDPLTVIPALLEARDDETDYTEWASDFGMPRIVCWDAAWALRQFDDEAFRQSGFYDRARREAPHLFEPFLAGKISRSDRRKLWFFVSRLGAEAKPFVPQLVDAMQRMPNSNESILSILSDLGANAAAAVPAIRKLLETPPPQDESETDVSLIAACTLLRIDHNDNPQAWARVLTGLDSYRTEAEVRELEFNPGAELVFKTLGKLGPGAKPAVPKLIELLNFSLDQAHESTVIAEVFGQIGPNASEAAPTLVRQLFWSEYDDEKPTRTALLRIGPDALPALVKGLETFQDEEEHCVRILEVIGQFGGKADSAVAAVVRSCGDGRRDVRAAAARALGEIHASPEIVIPELLRLLKDERPVVRAQAADSLGNFKMAASRAVFPLTTTLQDEFIDVRAASAEALGNIGRAVKPAIHALEQARSDPSPLVRDVAKQSLAKLK